MMSEITQAGREARDKVLAVDNDPRTLRANLESALYAFNAARAEDGWEPVTLVVPEGVSK